MIKVHQKFLITIVFCLLIVPIGYLLGFKDNTHIAGVENKYTLPSLQEKEWLNRSFQKSFENWWNGNFGYRKFMLKIKNTIYDTMNLNRFHAGASGDIIQGYNNFLFSKVYFSLCSKKCPPIPASLERISELHNKLKTVGIDIFFIIAPSKVETYYQYTPAWIRPFLSNGCNIYKKISDTLERSNISAYNSQILMNSIKEKDMYPFNNGGTHWNHYGAAKTLIESFKKFNLGDIKITHINNQDKPISTERDLSRLLNTYYKYSNKNETFMQPKLHSSDITDKKITLIGDSFSQEYVINLKKVYKNHDILHFENKPISNHDFAKIIKHTDIIILMYTAPNIIRSNKNLYTRIDLLLEYLEPKYNFNENNENIEIIGFSNKEKWGRWTDTDISKTPSITINNIRANHDIEINFDIMPFVKKNHLLQEVDIYSSGKKLDTWVFKWGEKDFSKKLFVSKSDINSNGTLKLEFDVKYPQSPYNLGLGNDKRLLGIGIKSLKYKYMKGN